MANFDYAGRHAYHLVIVTSAREPVLVDDFASETVADLERAASATCFELLAYVVMPDHVHVLALGLSDEATATRSVQRFKQFAGYRFKKETGRSLWQWSFFDHTLRREEDLIAVARYISGNPVRAGLASFEGEWPYQGGTMVSGAKAPSLRAAEDDSAPPDGARAPSLRAAEDDSAPPDGATAPSLRAAEDDSAPPDGAKAPSLHSRLDRSAVITGGTR